MLLVSVLAVGCGDDSEPGSGGTGSGGEVGSSSETGWPSRPAPACNEGEYQCASETVGQRCAEDGTWVDDPCVGYDRCGWAGYCVTPCADFNDAGSLGCEFVVLPAADGAPTSALWVTNPEPAGAVEITIYESDGAVEHPLFTAEVAAASALRWELPPRAPDSTALRLRSSGRVGAVRHSGDASLLQPHGGLGTIVASWPADSTGSSTVEVVAMRDDTSIRWTVPGEPEREAMLDALQRLRIDADAGEDLSGTIVHALGGAVVTSAIGCDAVGATGSCAGREQLMPIGSWADRYVVPPLSLPIDEPIVWRVFAGSTDPTSIVTEPPQLAQDACSSPAELLGDVCVLPGRGAFIELTVPSSTAFIVQSLGGWEEPVMVVGYLPGASGPAMVQLAPTEHWHDAATLAVEPGWDAHVAELTRRTQETERHPREGLQPWAALGESGALFDYEHRRLSLAEPVHLTELLAALQYGHRTIPDCTGDCIETYAHAARFRVLYEVP